MSDAVAHLARGRGRREAMPELPATLRPADEDAAYALQSCLHEHYRSSGLGHVVGYKIGCTTEVMQRYLGIATPCAGGILAPSLRNSEARFEHGDFVRVGVECELAVRLGKDIPGGGAQASKAELRDAVDTVMCAIEVVDDRWRDFAKVKTPSLIADDFFGAGAVLGEPCAHWRSLDLAGLRAQMWVNEASVGEGRGADILGEPFAALAWLARSRGRRRSADQVALPAGSVVLLGSMVQTCWLAAGDQVRIEVQELGGAFAQFR